MQEIQNPNPELQEAKRANDITKVGLIISFLMTIASLIYTHKSLETSRNSTIVAEDALILQRNQMDSTTAQEKRREKDEDEKNRKFLELAQKQIDALAGQSQIIEANQKRTELAEQPYLQIVDAGFFPVHLDSVYFRYSITNFGTRPVVLKESKFHILDSKFIPVDSAIIVANAILAKSTSADRYHTFKTLKGRKLVINLDYILSLGNLYFCYNLQYFDPQETC